MTANKEYESASHRVRHLGVKQYMWVPCGLLKPWTYVNSYSVTFKNILTWVRCDHKPGATDAEKKLRRKGSWEETTGRASWRRRYVSLPGKGRGSKCMDRRVGAPNPPKAKHISEAANCKHAWVEGALSPPPGSRGFW